MTAPAGHALRAVLLSCLLACGAARAADEVWGIRFACPNDSHEALAADVGHYLSGLGIASSLYIVTQHDGTLAYALATSPGDTSTLDFHARPEFAIPQELDWVTTHDGALRGVATVTEKEIALTLMQRGRVTEFSGGACTAGVLREHVGLRKNIVAWAERLEWGWPDGESAEWNCRYWQAGNLIDEFELRPALQDIFLHPQKYSFGCYTAAKLVIVQGTLDYFHRLRPSRQQASLIEERLLADGDPLGAIEPGGVWSFEPGFDAAQARHPGKLVRVLHGVAPRNFVPGDWVYFLNDDRTSYARTGYEGSNPIYLGRDRFADYYNDHDHAYSFEEKLNEIYQWRNGVFNRVRDAAKAKPLAPADYERLARSPAAGGMVLPLRIVPYFFGYEELPAVGER